MFGWITLHTLHHDGNRIGMNENNLQGDVFWWLRNNYGPVVNHQARIEIKARDELIAVQAAEIERLRAENAKLETELVEWKAMYGQATGRV
jgi:O-glycosyl hydrolase